MRYVYNSLTEGIYLSFSTFLPPLLYPHSSLILFFSLSLPYSSSSSPLFPNPAFDSTFLFQRYLSLDDRVAWGYFEFTEDVFSGETVEEWVPLTGKQGNEKEGNVNIILSLQVSLQLWGICMWVADRVPK